MRSLLFILFTNLLACSSIVPISQRDSGRMGDLRVSSRPILENEASPPIYTKRTDIGVSPKQVENRSGSLYRVEDSRNQLFAEALPGVGGYIDVEVASNRLDAKKSDAPGGAAPSAPAGANAPGKNEQKAEELEQTLIKALPDLDPGQNNPVLIKTFKMRVMRILDNGDYVVQYDRVSQSADDASTLTAKARVPYDAVAKNAKVTTSDLRDVEFFAMNSAENITRQSSGWEDDYTLRLSGFSEAKSRVVQELAAKREQLENVKKQMRTRLETMGSERRLVAKERDRLAKQRADLEQKEQEMNQKVADMETQVKEKTAELDKIYAERAAQKGQLKDDEKDKQSKEKEKKK